MKRIELSNGVILTDKWMTAELQGYRLTILQVRQVFEGEDHMAECQCAEPGCDCGGCEFIVRYYRKGMRVYNSSFDTVSIGCVEFDAADTEKVRRWL